MIRRFVPGLLLVLWPLAALAESEPLRLAVVVGANQGQSQTAPLRYAHDDARRVAALLAELGRFADDGVSLHLEPDPQAVLAALDGALARAEGHDDALLLFYFSGHADSRALYVGGQPLPTAELQTRLSDTRATVRVGIVDACAGGEWTGTKGLVEVPTFDVSATLGLESEGTVLLASSSGVESAHELEHLGGSLFTHHLLAGLRGAADTQRDGAVSLEEAFTYARYRTIRDAGRRVKQPQHPSFRFDLSGRSSVTLTRPDQQPGALVLAGLDAPTDVLDLNRGTPVVDLPEADAPIRLVLPPGRYLLRRLDPDRPASAEFEVTPGTPLELTEADLVPLPEGEGRDKANRRPLPDLTVPAGTAQIGMSVGASMNDYDRDGRWAVSRWGVSSLSGRFGITDRLAYRFPLVLAYRFGDADLQLSPALGLSGLRFEPLVGLVVPATASLDGRWFLDDRFALGLGVSGGAFWTGWEEDPGWSNFHGNTRIAALWSPIDRLTLSLGVQGTVSKSRTLSVDTGEWNWGTVTWGLGVGGSKQYEPLIRFELSPAFSLVGNASVGASWIEIADRWLPSADASLGVRLRF